MLTLTLKLIDLLWTFCCDYKCVCSVFLAGLMSVNAGNLVSSRTRNDFGIFISSDEV